MSDRPGSIAALVRRHPGIAVDSNVLIYLLEDDADRADAAAALVDAIAEARTDGVLSSAALAEVLVGPARGDDGVAFEQAAATIRDLGFRIVPLDASAAEDAAWIRGRTGLGLPDAIHVACARAGGATVFVTNDRVIPAQPGLEVVYLDDLASPEERASDRVPERGDLVSERADVS